MFDRWSPHPRYRLYTSPWSYLSAFGRTTVEEFECEICRRFDVAGAVCVPMARTGLYLTILEMIRPGQKVILSPLTIIDVVNAVVLAGGVPVFCDIDRGSCGIDPGKTESLIDRDTGAVVITHLHGQTAGAHVFRDLCARRGVRLIEDAAQAFGAIERGRRLGTIGDVGIYSFGFFKNLSTWQGGMVVSNDLKLIERIRARVRTFPEIPARRLVMRTLSGMIVDVGTSPPLFSTFAYPIVRRRFAGVERLLDPESRSMRLNKFPSEYLQRIKPWQATVGLRQLDRVDADTAVRIDHARQYHERLVGLPGITQPPQTYDGTNIFTYFPIQIRDRERLLEFAYRRGRDFAAQHLRNCADLPGFDEYWRDCPNARAAAGELVLLPTYPRYPESEVKRTIEVLREFVVESGSQ